ncbi:tRNA-uridine aminocarboxypropyltransferase [Larsenimonas salina]|uniref:tRNA-uridine aminocarboxypropyltransferase n=1 Tax=Larsenimonas salina TaxID=1295565 RepID=UPI0020738324|nr:DTW domain-containing protein [Larsenimonas salina]MCM5704338.1 DTW domain-containing protein [Larsenimonas salina]
MSEPVSSSGHPPKPFNARGSFVVRCPTCRMPERNCLCPYKVTTESRARFVLLTHRLEHNKPTNTGRLIRDCLPETPVFTWSRTEHDPELLTLLNDPAYLPLIIFPDDQPDYAERVVGPDAVERALEQTRRPLFILLDGTWRQARKMFRKSPYLQDLKVLPLSSTRTTRYRLRKSASEAHLCTAEVGAELLTLAGDARAAQVLDDYFDIFNTCYAESRRHHTTETSTPAMERQLARKHQR